jgi:hypothetical protein
MNSVSIRNYGETLAVIKELKKLGFLKSSKPKKKRIVQDLKQESDLVGYAIDNIPSFRAINPDMSQSQIGDIQRRQAAGFATLRDEVTQQRLEDIDALQRQRAGDITRFQSEFNRFFTSIPERPFDPFANLNPQNLDNSIPDINENTFDGGINEGAPDITTQLPTTVFPIDEEIPAPKIKSKPVGKKQVFKTKRFQALTNLGLSPPPPQKGSTRGEIEDYYFSITNILGITPITKTLSIKALFKEIYRIIDEEANKL